MALKGFLASGFQQLIGASRLKGANTQWVGEPNKLTYTGNTANISSPLFLFGMNYLDWTPTADVIVTDTTTLFSSNPTTEVQITIRNSSVSRSITLNNAGTVSGSLVGQGVATIGPGCSITYMYDVTAARWRELSRTAQYRNSAYIVTGSAIVLVTSRLQSIDISASADRTVTTLTPAAGSASGDIVHLYVGGSSNTITLQQDTTGAVSNGLLMNGDYAMTQYSSISFIYNGLRWIEQSRNMVGGY